MADEQHTTFASQPMEEFVDEAITDPAELMALEKKLNQQGQSRRGKWWWITVGAIAVCLLLDQLLYIFFPGVSLTIATLIAFALTTGLLILLALKAIGL